MMLPVKPRSPSAINRLLEELSWVGPSIRNYRNGGRGYENVLMAEAFQALDFLPRTAFLGSVLSAARGADAARKELVSEIESATITLLPGNVPLVPSGSRHQLKLPVQPDGIIESPGTYAILEAKRVRSSSFQPEQLSREYVVALREAGDRLPILLLVLGTPPPVKVKRHAKLEIQAAIELHLESVLARAENHQITAKRARELIPNVACWVTWGKISEVVSSQRKLFEAVDPSVAGCVDRIARSVVAAIAWHGPE